jgi:hypothetical protein
MTMKRFFGVVSSTVLLILLTMPQKAAAIALPDGGNCNVGYSCLEIRNVGTDTFSIGISSDGTYGLYATGSRYAVYASSGYTGATGVSGNAPGIGVEGTSMPGFGVRGISSSGIGVEGQSSTNDGVHAVSYSASRSGIHAQNATPGGGGWGIYASAGGNGQAVHGENTNSSGWAGYFNGKVYASSGYTSSDIRLKKDIAALSYGLREVSKLRPVKFRWRDEVRGRGEQVGLIAQEIEKVVPEVVDTDAKSGMLSVNYPALVPVLISAVQEQQKIIAEQDARISRLEHRPVLSSTFGGGLSTVALVASAIALLVMAIRRKRQVAAPANI